MHLRAYHSPAHYVGTFFMDHLREVPFLSQYLCCHGKWLLHLQHVAPSAYSVGLLPAISKLWTSEPMAYNGLHLQHSSFNDNSSLLRKHLPTQIGAVPQLRNPRRSFHSSKHLVNSEKPNSDSLPVPHTQT